MTLLEFLRSLIATTGNVARLTELRTPVESVIFDNVFTNRISRATDEISLAEITRVTKARPVISRGGHAIPLDMKSAASTRIEPLSIRLSDFLTGAQLNSLRHLYGTGGENAEALVTAEIDRIVMDLMRTTELTRNALCAQALKGKIDFMMDSNGMTERYVIDFGTTQSLSLTTLLDDESATLVTLMNALRKMKKKITDAGYAGSPVILAGPNAWSTIANLVMATRSEGRMGAAIDGAVISFMGYKIYLADETYNDKDVSGKDIVKDAIDTNSLCMVIPSLAELDYCAIDDLQGALQATPFFSKPVQIEDPSGIKIISESKPMPLIAPASICWATVTASEGERSSLTIINNVTVNTSDQAEGQNVETQNTDVQADAGTQAAAKSTK